jgi:5-methylcytosine-specific restriction endonuclease McrA
MGMTTRQQGWQGSKWIRPERRLAIYLRDGLACVWCGAAVEDGVSLSLDHVTCRVHGGDNGNSNLVTACSRCNGSRGSRSVAVPTSSRSRR